jgi:hypothetical protein
VNSGSVQGESVPLDRRERILDWRDELRRVTPLLAELPIGARLAVMEVVATFAREDDKVPGESRAEPVSHGIPDAA